MTNISTLADRAMIVNLSISQWQGYRLDKEATRELTERAGAEGDAARVNKHLIPKSAFAAISSAVNALRTQLHAATLPWRDNGDRILTRQMYAGFIAEHERLAAAFDAEVHKFITVAYPIEVERASFRMGELFNASDYPTPSQLVRRFGVSLTIDPVATAGDFRVGIDPAHVERVKADIETQTEKRLRNAMQDIWARLLERVAFAQERLADPEAKFRTNTVANVTDLVENMPGLNLVDDPQLAQICRELDQVFGSVTVKDLRKDASVRGAVAAEAQIIVDKMRGFMAAFG